MKRDRQGEDSRGQRYQMFNAFFSVFIAGRDIPVHHFMDLTVLYLFLVKVCSHPSFSRCLHKAS